MAAPTVCVVIPSYNRPQELRRALESVAAQTELPDEVIVCDDGSKVELRPIVEHFEGRLSARCIRIENSGSPARPRNVAAKAASAEWLAFLDSDDWWATEKLARLKATARATPCEVIHHPLQLAANDPERLRGRLDTVGQDFSKSMPPLSHLLCIGNPVAQSGSAILRTAYLDLGGTDESLNVVDDYDLWIRSAANGHVFHFLPECLGTYWVSDENISTEPLRQIRLHVETLTRHRHQLPPAEQLFAAGFENYMAGTFFMTAGDRKNARTRLRQAKPLRTWKLRAARWAKLIRLGLAK